MDPGTKRGVTMKKQRVYRAVMLGCLSLVIIRGTVRTAISQKNQVEIEPEIARLIERLNMPPDRAEMNQAELHEAIRDLARMGDTVIDPMMNKVRQDNGVSFEHRIVRVLRAINTPKAQEALLDIALGRSGIKTTVSGWAALKYIETLQDKSGARKLLASERDDVLSHALVALVGTPVDAELLTRLKELLGAESHFLRFNAARVMAADPSEAYVREKTSAIIVLLSNIIKDS
jgi:HEAT repeat protein